MADGIAADISLIHQLPAGQRQGDEAAGNAGGAGTAITLEHVAVDCDGPLAQRLQIHRGPEAATDEPLDLGAAG